MREASVKAICYSRYGSPDVLHVEDVADPVPHDGEVLIRVRAAEATKSDCELRSFHYAVKWFWLPLRIALGVRRPRRRILGGYFSGEIAALGRGVTGFSVGEAVFGSAGLHLGGYGEYVALSSHYTIVPKPSNMTFAEAAAVPLGGLNALHFMRLATIAPGEAVLVNGAGGSIGAHAVQIAKSMGAEVTGVDHGIKEAFVRQVGADRFIDYTRDDYTAIGQRFDVVFDMVARSNYSACIRVLRPGGRYLSGNPRLSVMLRSVFTTRFTDKIARFAFAHETREELATLKTMIEAGEIKSIVDRVYPMAQAADAHRLVESEQRRGAVVIEID
ncbi:MAG: NAD(P)-dependent alcohol dehydrogenase [Vicinamibacterales bacterium]